MAAQLWLDGAAPAADRLAALAQHNYGHYTSFVAEPAGVRGLALHLQRLREDAQHVSGCEPDLDALRAELRTCVPRDQRCWVRITLYPDGFDLAQPARVPERIARLLSVRPLIDAPATAQRLSRVAMLREYPQHKHTGLYAALQARALAQRAGADDALLCTNDDQIAEGPTWNLGVIDADGLCWPEAPALCGTTQRLLSAALSERHGMPSRSAVLRPTDLQRARLVFSCNARWPVRPVLSLDGQRLPSDPTLVQLLASAWQALPADPI